MTNRHTKFLNIILLNTPVIEKKHFLFTNFNTLYIEHAGQK
jgi:hypothetical protein